MRKLRPLGPQSGGSTQNAANETSRRFLYPCTRKGFRRSRQNPVALFSVRLNFGCTDRLSISGRMPSSPWPWGENSRDRGLSRNIREVRHTPSGTTARATYITRPANWNYRLRCHPVHRANGARGVGRRRVIHRHDRHQLWVAAAGAGHPTLFATSFSNVLRSRAELAYCSGLAVKSFCSRASTCGFLQQSEPTSRSSS